MYVARLKHKGWGESDNFYRAVLRREISVEKHAPPWIGESSNWASTVCASMSCTDITCTLEEWHLNFGHGRNSRVPKVNQKPVSPLKLQLVFLARCQSYVGT